MDILTFMKDLNYMNGYKQVIINRILLIRRLLINNYHIDVPIEIITYCILYELTEKECIDYINLLLEI